MIAYLRKLFLRAKLNKRWLEAQANYEAAVRRGDTRAQAWTFQKLRHATNQRLRAGL